MVLCCATYLLIGRVHVSPATLALLLDSTFRRTRAEIIGNDLTSVLHVQEVGCERALGGVGIMSSLLALLLFLTGSSRLYLCGRSRRGHADELSSRILKVGQDVVGTLSSGLSEQKVSLTDVVLSERAEQLQNGTQASNSL